MALKESISFYIGCFIILCICIIVLLLISPVKKNFYDLKEQYPILYYNLHQNNKNYQSVLNEILNGLNIDRIDINRLTSEHLSQYPTSEHLSQNPTFEHWLEYPNSEHCQNMVYIFPLFINGELSKKSSEFKTLINLLNNQPEIKSVYFWKFPPKSAFKQHIESNTNDIMRYTLCINGMGCTEEHSSLWVNGDIKKLVYDDYVLWDPSKEFSLHNETEDDIIYLNVDVKKNINIPLGTAPE